MHRLSSLHSERDERLFDSVVVITDRVVLDRQLQNTIYQFDHRQGVVQKIDEDSRQLAEALEAGVPIIITTLQKFPFVSAQLTKLSEERGEGGKGHLPTRKYAVIIDEAHSSQSGETATELKGVLGGAGLRRKAHERAMRLVQSQQAGGSFGFGFDRGSRRLDRLFGEDVSVQRQHAGGVLLKRSDTRRVQSKSFGCRSRGGRMASARRVDIAEDLCGFDAQGLVDLFEKFHLIGRDHAIGLCKRRHECGERLFGGVFERFEFLFQAHKRHGNQCEPLEMGVQAFPTARR